jgi:hypothetical protein
LGFFLFLVWKRFCVFISFGVAPIIMVTIVTCLNPSSFHYRSLSENKMSAEAWKLCMTWIFNDTSFVMSM